MKVKVNGVGEGEEGGMYVCVCVNMYMCIGNIKFYSRFDVVSINALIIDVVDPLPFWFWFTS